MNDRPFSVSLNERQKIPPTFVKLPGISHSVGSVKSFLSSSAPYFHFSFVKHPKFTRVGESTLFMQSRRFAPRRYVCIIEAIITEYHILFEVSGGPLWLICDGLKGPSRTEQDAKPLQRFVKAYPPWAHGQRLYRYQRLLIGSFGPFSALHRYKNLNILGGTYGYPPNPRVLPALRREDHRSLLLGGSVPVPHSDKLHLQA